MAFFRNSVINWLNLHYGIFAIALNGGEAFFFIYLLKAGVPVPGVLLSLALILLSRFLIRPLVVPAAARWGLRAMVLAGTLTSALPFLLLPAVHGIGGILVALIAVSAIGSTLYWTAYHAYFARLGDDAHRGQQIGAREAGAAVVSIASPLLTGWLLVAFGPAVSFGANAAIAALAALPLLWAPDVTVSRHMPGTLRTAWPGMLLFAADGWIGAGNVFFWQIALFVSVQQNFLGYGGAMAVAALVGAVGSMTLGRHIDAGHGGRAVWYALGLLGLIVTLRAAATGQVALAVTANALGGLGYCLYIPTLMTPVYTMAKQSRCTLRFHVATEGGWDLGGGVALLLAALGATLHMPLAAGVLLALPGVAASAALLRRYYVRAAMARGPVQAAEY